MKETLPKSIGNAYGFQAFNTISWQICLGTPLILFARELGASSTTIGILSGLTPLLTVAQLPVAQHAEEFGYRRLMLLGWSTRVILLGFLCVLPILHPYLPADTTVNLLLVVMFFFNLMRGVASGAWFPWITSLVPESLRGAYLTRDRVFINFATILALAISAGLLKKHQDMHHYALVFLASFAAGVASLWFLNRIPEARRTVSEETSQTGFRWTQVFQYREFRRILFLNAMVQFAISANGPYVILFLKDKAGAGEGTILALTAASAAMAMAALFIAGRNLDRSGSKPYLILVVFWWMIYFLLWALTASGWLVHRREWAMALLVVSGFFGCIYELSFTRLLMNTIGDRVGRAHFYAVYGVIVSILIGVMPIFWGVILDCLRDMEWRIYGCPMDGFTLFFASEWLMIFVVAVILLRVKEPKSHSTRVVMYEIFVTLPARGLSFLFQRFR